MNFPIFTSSEKAQNQVKTVGAKKYPWEDLQVGQSFQIGPDVIVKFSTIQSSCSKMGKKLNRRFRAINHGECVGIEVARLPDEVKPVDFFEKE